MARTRDEVEAAIRQILVEAWRIPEESITPEASFAGTLRLDSVERVDLILILHKRLGFKLPLERYREVDTLGKLVDFVLGVLEEQERGRAG